MIRSIAIVVATLGFAAGALANDRVLYFPVTGLAHTTLRSVLTARSGTPASARAFGAG